MGPRTLDHYIDELRRRRPPWLHGYPSLLSLLAGHIVDSSSDLGYRPRWVTVGAENLLTHQANSMRAAFGTEPVQHYGMAEAVANASECSSGRLHCDEDFAAMEFVQDGKDRHRVVGTNLSNPATPLIRYDTGDLASPASDGCDCGLPGRIVSRVDGRLEDYVVLPSGARIGRLDHVFKDLVSIREAQIVQSRPGAVTIRVVPGPNYDEREERALLAEARKRMGSDMEIEIQHTELLERTDHGKLRLVVSHLHEPGVERE